jgi:hypothetical protein
MKYKLKQITPKITAVVIKNQYDRAMLFCRVQEFYESAGNSFRDKKFSIWNYFKWYSDKYKKGCFSYTIDYTGFNLPLIVAKKCYEINSVESPYDELMKKITDDLWENIGEGRYLIGVDSLKNSTFDHELAHALYYTDREYRLEMDSLTSKMNKNNIKRYKKNLSALGYCSSVFKDEIQAYMSTEVNKKITRGTTNAKKIHQLYKSIFKKYKSKINT